MRCHISRHSVFRGGDVDSNPSSGEVTEPAQFCLCYVLNEAFFSHAYETDSRLEHILDEEAGSETETDPLDP